MAVGFRRTLSTLTSPKSVAPSFLLDCARPKKLSYARVRTVSFEDYCNEEEEERKAAMGRVRGLEECVAAAESGCEEVYRALVNARVSLLNLLTPTF
uniref:Uncharacterized protein n=1 Tax=Oryza brachyantha TaxID=4533 RepID=J3N4J2_ORYBR